MVGLDKDPLEIKGLLYDLFLSENCFPLFTAYLMLLIKGFATAPI